MKSAMAIQCLPQGVTQKSETYRLVDAAIAVLEQSGLPYTVGGFETVVEGPLEQLFDVAQAMHRATLEAGAPGIASYLKIFSSPNLGSTEEKTSKYRAAGH